MKSHPAIRELAILTSLILPLLAGCVPPKAFDTSSGHIQREAEPKKADTPPPPAPVRAAPYTPPPRPAPAIPTYTVVVNDVAVKDLLFSIARDTQYNIDIHPGITGRVSLNAVNEPLPAILDRIARQASLRYVMDGKTVSIMPDSPYLRTYKVNYVNLSRNTSSSIGVASQIAATGSGSLTSGGSSTSGGNNSNTSVTTTSVNDYWAVLKDNIVNILYATKAEQKKSEERAAIAEANRIQIEMRGNEGSASAAKNQEIIRSVQQNIQVQPGDSEREVIVNAVAGTVSVFANERQHQLVQEYLDKVTHASQRQVMIEATIVEVTLKDQYRAGINWQSLATAATGWAINTAGSGIGGTNLANQLQPFYTATYTNNDKWDFKATIDLLESFGNTKVLSSPKLMALNNQTALLKVVNNLVYFSLEVAQGTVTAGGIILPSNVTTTAHTIPVGVVMSVTPQIADNGQVTLTVRPTISRKAGDVEDPNPQLKQGGLNISNKVPVIQVREMESLLQVRSGQTVILGGLIQDDLSGARDGLPGLSRPEGIGAIFGQHERLNSQTELVIFLRPTIVNDGALQDDELMRFQRLLPARTSIAQ
jgi:general secretion pathway protein D